MTDQAKQIQEQISAMEQASKLHPHDWIVLRAQLTAIQGERDKLREERKQYPLLNMVAQRAEKAEKRAEHAEGERDALRATAPTVTGDTSDGYHTFNELYAYRKAYHALLFNEWAARGVYDVHKAWKHSDGEPCFGGGWFIVVAETPQGQISNHYESPDWELFQVPERERGNEYDGHTPRMALQRLLELAEATLHAGEDRTTM